jgi:hypothetical protein
MDAVWVRTIYRIANFSDNYSLSTSDGKAIGRKIQIIVKVDELESTRYYNMRNGKYLKNNNAYTTST